MFVARPSGGPEVRVRAALLALLLAPAAPASPAPASPAPAPASPAPATSKVSAEALEAEIAAVEQEIARGLAGLRLADSPATPYHATVYLVRAEVLSLDGSYGGIITDVHEDQAAAGVELRVGAPERDQTGVFGQDGAFPRFILSLGPSAELTRRKLWLGLDQAFRRATGVYAQKLAILARLAGEPVPSDFGPKPEPIVRQPAPPPPSEAIDREGLRELVKALSRRFADHPTIDNGDVFVQVLRSHVTTITSEGVVLHEQRDRAVLAVIADTRAPDGMHLDHGAAIHLQELPRATDELRQRGEELVDGVLRELAEMAEAPMLDDDYDGPVLFAGPAAAQLLASTVAVHIGGNPAPLGDNGRVRDFEPHWQDSLGKSVLPAFLDLEDDPREGFGAYQIDAQGFSAKPLTLVKNGVLQELLMTRSPNTHRKESNGRARVSPGLAWGASISNLSLRSKKRGASPKALEKELLRRAREDGYEYAYVVESLRDGNILGPVNREGATSYSTGRKVSLPLPAKVYRVEASGKRTLVRGAVLAPVSMRVLRRIRAVGQAAPALPLRIAPGAVGGFAAETGMDGILSNTVDVSVSTPDLLLDGLELLVERSEHERLPLLEHPLRRGQTPPTPPAEEAE
jgi:TldD protein